MMMMMIMASSATTPILSFKKPSFIQWHKMTFHGTSLYPTPQKPSFLHHHHQYHLIKTSKPISGFCVMSSNDGGTVDPTPQNPSNDASSEHTEAEMLSFLETEKMISEWRKKGFDVVVPTSVSQTTQVENFESEEEMEGFGSYGDGDGDGDGEVDEISDYVEPSDSPELPGIGFSDYFGLLGMKEKEVSSDSNQHRPIFPIRSNRNEEVSSTPLRQEPSEQEPYEQPTFQEFEDFKAFGADGYVDLFVRMLGIDNDPLEREQAVIVLWKHSQGGKRNIDGIMKFHGCISLTVNLLKSDSSLTCEAAGGLLRMVSSVDQYRDTVAESGAIEEIAGLLSRSSLTAEVKEQVLGTLWNLSADEKFRMKIANIDILPILIKAFDDEKVELQEAAGGVLANLALSHSNHQIMVEAGVIPKLAKFLKKEAQASKAIKIEAKNALLEFAKDEFYRILIVEEGLVLVPMVGADAYNKCLNVLNSIPSLPGIDYDTIELVGLNPEADNLAVDEAQLNAMVAESDQKFLALSGCIEMEYGRELQPESLTTQYTLLPWVDGVGRLCLILQLEDMSAISRAAQSVADASISEHMRISFMIAGAVKHLVRLLNHNDENVRLSASNALERLSASNTVCQNIKTEDAVHPLLKALKNTQIAANLLEKTLNILARILDPGEEMKSKVDGSEKALNATKSPNETNLSIDTTRENVLDSAVISRLIEILKTSSPNLQTKAASILEYIAIAVPCMDTITATNIESGLDAVFQERLSNVTDVEDDLYTLQPELSILETEEAGLAISAASRLLTKLLDDEQFRRTINSSHFIQMLRRILKSDIPIHNKEWVAACLVKLHSSTISHLSSNNPINTEVTLYETIPRLLEKIKTSFSPEAQELAVIELNTIISKGVVDYSRAVADQGGIFPLVKVMEEGSREAVESSLAILFNLSMDSENHPAIIAAGAVPVLRRIVLSEGPQWRRALHLLWTLPTQ